MKKMLMENSDVESLKGFILDTIRSTRMPYIEVLVGLMNRQFISDSVWNDIGEHCPKITQTQMNCLAIQPSEIQSAIIEFVKLGAKIEVAIEEYTGTFISDDVVSHA